MHIGELLPAMASTVEDAVEFGPSSSLCVIPSLLQSRTVTLEREHSLRLYKQYKTPMWATVIELANATTTEFSRRTVTVTALEGGRNRPNGKMCWCWQMRGMRVHRSYGDDEITV